MTPVRSIIASAATCAAQSSAWAHAENITAIIVGGVVMTVLLWKFLG